MKRIKSTSRLFEQIIGVLGSVIGIASGSFILFIKSGGHQGNSFLAIIAIIGALLGFISSFYVDRDLDYAGIGFVLAAIFVLLGTTHMGVLGAILLLIAGMSTLFRK